MVRCMDCLSDTWMAGQRETGGDLLEEAKARRKAGRCIREPWSWYFGESRLEGSRDPNDGEMGEAEKQWKQEASPGLRPANGQWEA